jgi:hypothetical protein
VGAESAWPNKVRRQDLEIKMILACSRNALLPSWYYRLSAAAGLVSLPKAECAVGETPQVRPAAVGGIERRLFCATAVKQTAPHFAALLISLVLSRPSPTCVRAD